MKKTIPAAACMIALGLMLGGCASGRGNVGATAAPATPKPTATVKPTASPMAAISAAPMTSPDTTADAVAKSTAAGMTPAQAQKTAEKISEDVERLSEVDDAEVILDGERALIAVEFDDQYSAGLDERMKKMIEEKAKAADEQLKDVRITDDDTLYGQVKGLAERMTKATGLDELADDFGSLWDRLTDM